MRALIFLVSLSLLLSCKKEPTFWNADLSVPILTTRLTVADFVADSLIDINSEGSITLRYSGDIFNVGIDSFLIIEPDTVENFFGIAPLSQFTFDPGQTFFSTNNSFEINGIDTELKSASLKNGMLKLTALNTITSELNFKVSIPKALKNGQPLYFESIIPAKIGDQNGEKTLNIDLDGYTLDLTGINGFEFNTLNVQFSLNVPIGSPAVTVFITDSVVLSLTYSDLQFSFATGYFGSESLEINSSADFLNFADLSGAVLDIDEVQADLRITNGFGIDIQTFIYQFKAQNNALLSALNLQNSLVNNPINLSRASFTGNVLSPFVKIYNLDNINSNLDEILELLPDSISIVGEVNANPFGNISNYNDFATDQSSLSAEIDLNVPFKFSIDNLNLKDTVEFKWNETSTNLTSGILYIASENTFPIDIELYVKSMNSEYLELLDLTNYLDNADVGLISGNSDSSISKSILKYNLDPSAIDKLKHTSFLSIVAKFRTSDYPSQVEFNATNELLLKVAINANANIIFE